MSADDASFTYDTQELRVCRVCLSTNGKLILITHRISHVFTEISGIPISRFDGLPQHICSYCHAGLQKCANFKLKCQTANKWLMNHLQHGMLRTQYIKSLDTKHFEHNMCMSKIVSVNLPEENNHGDQNIKMEMEVVTEIEQNIVESSDEQSITKPLYVNINDQIERSVNDIILKSELDEESDSLMDVPDPIDDIKINPDKTQNDCSDETDTNNSDDEDYRLLSSVDDDSGDDKCHINDDKCHINYDSDDNKCHINDDWSDKNHCWSTDDPKKLRKELSACSSITNDDYKKIFYNYVIAKYIDKTIPSNDQIELYNSDNESHLEVNDLPSFNENSDDDDDHDNEKNRAVTDKGKKKIFYAYIKHKYFNKDTPAEVKNAIELIRAEMKMLGRKFKGKSEEEILSCAKTYNFNVKFLTLNEQINEIKKRKGNRKYINASFKCVKCFQGFRTESTYKSHMAYHDPSSGAFSCEVCHCRFSRLRALRKHQLTHKWKFICKQCDTICRSAWVFQRIVHIT